MDTGDWLEAGWAILDPQRRIVFINDTLAGWFEAECDLLTGQHLDTLLGKRVPEWLSPLEAVWVNPAPYLQRRLKQAGPDGPLWFELELAHNLSGWFFRLNSILPPYEELAEVAWDQHLGRIAERRQMYVRLLRAETQLDNLVRRWPGVIFSQRADFSFQYVSPRIEDRTGVPVAAWQHQPQRFWEVVHEADVEEIRQQCQRARQTPPGITHTFRIRHLQTGQAAYILEHRQAVISRSGLVLSYEGVWLDITRQTIAEKRLSSAAWKKTLATLTLGLAHDFSNMISGILSLSELFLAQIEADHPFAEGLNLIKQNSLQASQLVQRLVNLHRCKTGERNYHDLNQVIPELIDPVQKILPRRIQVETDLASGPLPLCLDVVEFRQVILNLALNAADAMPDRGKLVFRTRLHTAPEPLAHFHGAFPRLPCVCLSVEDNGQGIAPRHLPFLFDPFFTTKPLHKGSGLGLYNARLFVDKHQGAISVESTEGAGACFRLWLPQADFSEAEQAPVTPGGRRHRLLLLSEPGLFCESTAEFLRAHDYYVAVTSTRERALELLLSEECRFRGVMVLAGPHDKALIEFLPQLQRQKLPIKIILQVIGGLPDEIGRPWLEPVDLILNSETPEDKLIDKLNSLFNHTLSA